MITVIIPAFNEENTIGNVIRSCAANPLVTEIIVVDDVSDDNTQEIASAAGAKLLVSKKRGKGYSMKEGVIEAQNELIIFLDADIDPYPEGTIDNLIDPILKNEADFVKGNFTRNAGRVTLLVAKPLLAIFYPGLSAFNQPLSGMIAGKKKFFMKIDFFNDYGVDVGILIDMYLMKARMKEVTIGYIENKSKPWHALGKMSQEVSRAIITRAQRHTPELAEREIETISAIQKEMGKTLSAHLSSYHKMIIFDMDDTILEGRFIDNCAEKFGFRESLQQLREKEKDPIILTKRIGLLLKGRTIDELLDVVSGMSMISDITEVVKAYRDNGYITGIISNSYQLITNYVKKQIDVDFSMSNKLEYFEGSATGEVIIPSYFFASPEAICPHAYCKSHALVSACNKYKVAPENCIAVGDSRDDLCMILKAGKGYAFMTRDPELEEAASENIREKSFKMLLAQLDQFT